MIGHWLLTLTDEQESNVLGRRLGQMHCGLGMIDGQPDEGCVLQTAGCGAYRREMNHIITAEQRLGFGEAYSLHHHVGTRYDQLSNRFGVARVANAIRNRILTNRLWRTMSRPTFSEHPRCDTPVLVA
jgi:hypothetical protein